MQLILKNLQYFLPMFLLYMLNLLLVGIIVTNTMLVGFDPSPLTEIVLLGVAFPPLGVILGAWEFGFLIQTMF